MTGDSQYQIVMLCVHLLHIGADAFPQTAQAGDRIRVRSFDRYEQAPAVVEQFRKSASGTGMFRACKGMAGNEVDPFGQMRGDLCYDIRLDGTHIRHRYTRRQHRRDFAGHGPHDAHGNAEHDQIGPANGFFERIADLVAEADFARGGAGLRAACVARHLACEVTALHRPVHRRGDEPQTDECDLVINLAHAPASRQRVNASITRPVCAASPTVIRNPSGKP